MRCRGCGDQCRHEQTTSYHDETLRFYYTDCRICGLTLHEEDSELQERWGSDHVPGYYDPDDKIQICSCS